MVWDMRCNHRSGHFCQPVNIISNAHTEKGPGTPQTTKKKAKKSATPRPLMVSKKIMKATGIFSCCFSISGFSFSNRVGVEKIETGGEINKKILRNPRIVLQWKLKLQAKDMFTGGENRLSPAQKENPGICGLMVTCSLLYSGLRGTDL